MKTHPNLCARCGKKWPKMFRVPNKDWERYIAPCMQDSILCERCYTRIKRWIDRAASAPEAI